MDKRYQDGQENQSKNEQKNEQKNEHKEPLEVEAKSSRGEEEIDLRELIEVLLRRKWAIAALVVLAVFVAGVFTMFVQRESYVTTVLDMDFYQIREGEYPGGSTFDVGDITSPYITSRVVDKLGLGELGISSQDLRGMIELRELYYPLVDEEEEDDPEPAYQYRLTIYEQDDDRITTSLKRQILSAVVETYREEYSQEFMERPLFPRLADDVENILELDYPFMNRSLGSYQEMFLDHIDDITREIKLAEIERDIRGLEDRQEMETDWQEFDEMAEEDLDRLVREMETEGFYSTRHGLSFPEIGRRAERLKETRYETISAAIRTNTLTEDPETVIRHYENLIEELSLSKDKKLQEADYARELLKDARPLRTGSLPEMFPALIEEGDHDLVGEIFDTLYRDNFYPQLIQVSLEAAQDSIESSHEIRKLEDEIELMRGLGAEDAGEDEGEGDNPDVDLEQIKARVDEDTSRLVVELNQLVNINNDMMKEYYQQRAEQGIAFAMFPHHDVARGNLELNVALAGVLGLMVGVFGAFFHEFWKKSEPGRGFDSGSGKEE